MLTARACCLAAALAAAMGLSAEMEELALDFRRPVIVPEPQKMEYKSDVAVRITPETRFRIACSDRAAVEWVREKAKLWWNIDITPIPHPSSLIPHPPSSEAYSLSAKPDGVEIAAASLQGVRYAMYSLRQAAERESSGITTANYWLPALEIEDSPALAHRFCHFCWFPELSSQFIERQIRLAAYYKFNYVILEAWGVWKGDKYPIMSVPEGKMTVAEAHRLAALAKDLGVTLVPALNIFGHATGLRALSGKHSTLDTRPELQPLFEPANGWNWCLSNPDAVRFIRGMVEEMHEAYGNPPFFHIGCDEADPPTCPRCRAVKPYARLVEAHIAGMSDLLRKRGARTMMWHDQLLEKGKWKPFYATGDKDLSKMADTLPRDIVICDWYYGGDQRGKDGKGEYPTLEHFKSKGFDVVTCQFDKAAGIVAQGEYARDRGLFGFMETVWHHLRGREFGMMMQTSACAAWGHGQTNKGEGVRDRPVMTHWRQLGWDMGVTDYLETGLLRETITRDALDK